MKLLYCIESFYNKGGMECVLSAKANWLASHGYNVSIIVASQCNAPYAFDLDKSVQIIDLDVNKKKFVKSYHDKLSRHLERNHYDIVISMGGLEVRFLHDCKDASIKVVELHFAWNRFISCRHGFFSKIKGCVQTINYLLYLRKYQNIVVLTQHDKNFYKRIGIPTTCIYNPVTLSCGKKSDLRSKRIISVGRLDYQKGFDLLVKAWGLVVQEHPDWELRIYGEGVEKARLQRQIEKNNIINITICGASSNLSKNYLESSIYVMSSRYEGFALVLLEAASHGLPLVSFDCPAGPNELIRHGYNGLLVSLVGNIQDLANQINYLIDNDDVRYMMGQNAYNDISRFSIDNVMQQWISLFEFAK